MCLDEMGFFQPPAFGSHKPAFTGFFFAGISPLTITVQNIRLLATFTTTSTSMVLEDNGGGDELEFTVSNVADGGGQ